MPKSHSTYLVILAIVVAVLAGVYVRRDPAEMVSSTLPQSVQEGELKSNVAAAATSKVPNRVTNHEKKQKKKSPRTKISATKGKAQSKKKTKKKMDNSKRGTYKPLHACVDEDKNCNEWAKMGNCEKDSEYYEYMRHQCGKACGTCSWQDTLKYLARKSPRNGKVRMTLAKKLRSTMSTLDDFDHIASLLLDAKLIDQKLLSSEDEISLINSFWRSNKFESSLSYGWEYLNKLEDEDAIDNIAFLHALRLATMHRFDEARDAIEIGENKGTGRPSKMNSWCRLVALAKIADHEGREKDASSLFDRATRATVAQQHSALAREMSRPWARRVSKFHAGKSDEEPSADIDDGDMSSMDTGGWFPADSRPRENVPSDVDRRTIVVMADRRDDRERELGKALTAEEFRTEYFEAGKPVIIEGLLGDELLENSMFRKEEFLDTFGDLEIPLTRNSIDVVTRQRDLAKVDVDVVSLSDFVGGETTEDDNTKIAGLSKSAYFFGKHKILGDTMLNEIGYFPEIFREKLGDMDEEAKREGALFYVGLEGTGTAAHDHGAAWNAMLFGIKKWYCNGDVLYVPGRWIHAIVNEATSVGIAVQFST
eukprot:g2360.t1